MLGLDKILSALPDCLIGEDFFSNGGRVLNITSSGKKFKNIRKNILDIIRKINWKDGFFRKDIGWRVIKENK